MRRILLYFKRLAANRKLVKEVRKALTNYNCVRIRYRYLDDATYGVKAIKRAFKYHRKYIIQSGASLTLWNEYTVTVFKKEAADGYSVYHIDA